LKKRSKKLLLKIGPNRHRILRGASAWAAAPDQIAKVFWFFSPLLFLLPSVAFAHSDALDQQQKALQAEQAEAFRHHAAAAAARRAAAQVAARAAVLARQQVAAAAALRNLEDQTASAAATLASLDTQSQAAEQNLHQNEAALAALLPVMQRLSRQPAASMLAVPASPADAIRGVLVLQGIAAEIEDDARTVHAQARQVAILQAQTLAQQAVLTASVASQQKAEAALNRQIAAAHGAETSDLDTAASAAAAELVATANVHNLQSVIEKLQQKQRQEAAAARFARPSLAPDIPGNVLAATGAPVAGSIVQAYGAATVAGPAVGIMYRAAPGASVAAPCSGPVLFADPFQNYGLLVILDCGNNYDAVLSGMQHLDVTAGQSLARGQPIGQMQGYDASNPAAEPMLYVELRRNGTPVDPTAWLGRGGSG
jgi:septal ring factor EnvC (AmiA/AmiB activator)